MTLCVPLLLALLLAGPVRAEGQIDVEIILFRHLAADPSRFPAPREAASYEDLRPLEPAAEAAGPPGVAQQREFPHWTTLPGTRLRMAPLAKSLGRGGAYEVLLHTGWRQPVNSRHRVRLQAGDPPALDGGLQVLGAGRKMQVLGDFTLQLGDHTVRVRQSQQMRAGELRYVDQAVLGLLIQASPVNSAIDATDVSSPTAASGVGSDGADKGSAATAPQPGPSD